MENEFPVFAKIGIILLLLAAAIGIVFSIFRFSRSMSTEGINKVENNMKAFQLSEFDEYDQKIKTGTQVNTALEMYEGAEIAIVVRTANQMSASAGTGHNYGPYLEGTDKTTKVTTNLNSKKNAGDSWYTVNFNMSSGSITYNFETLPTRSTGTTTFINTTSKFLAELIKDDTGTIVGICFTQQ